MSKNIHKFKPLKLKVKRTFSDDVPLSERVVIIYKDNKDIVNKFCKDNDLDVKQTLRKIVNDAIEKDKEKQILQQQQKIKINIIKNDSPLSTKQSLPTRKIERSRKLIPISRKLTPVPTRKISIKNTRLI